MPMPPRPGGVATAAMVISAVAISRMLHGLLLM
jgi:hypothetical protein